MQNIILVSKFGGKIDWTWKEAFLGYWILLSFYAGVVMIVVIFLVPEIKYLIKKIFKRCFWEVKKVLMIFGFIVGLVFVFLLLFNIIQCLSQFLEGGAEGLERRIFFYFLFFIFSQVWVFVVFGVFREKICQYVYELFKHLEIKQEDFENTLETEVSRGGDKLKKLVFLKNIPSHIRKFTATYFKVESKIKSSKEKNKKIKRKSEIIKKSK